MTTWDGWESQLLAAANLTDNGSTRAFLDQWAKNANAASCRPNPVDISHVTSGSRNCKRLTPTRVAQTYTGHGQAASAFSSEIHSGDFPHLLKAFQGTDPYGPSNLADVEADLLLWGSSNFVAALEAEFGVTPTQPGGNVQGSSTGIHKGWHDLRTTINHGLPASVAASERMTGAALRKLAGARRVRL